MSNHPTIGWPGAQLFQDAEGTIPVMQEGDPVALILHGQPESVWKMHVDLSADHMEEAARVFRGDAVRKPSLPGLGGHPIYRGGFIDMRPNQIMQAVREASQ